MAQIPKEWHWERNSAFVEAMMGQGVRTSKVKVYICAILTLAFMFAGVSAEAGRKAHIIYGSAFAGAAITGFILAGVIAASDTTGGYLGDPADSTQNGAIVSGVVASLFTMASLTSFLTMPSAEANEEAQAKEKAHKRYIKEKSKLFEKQELKRLKEQDEDEDKEDEEKQEFDRLKKKYKKQGSLLRIESDTVLVDLISEPHYMPKDGRMSIKLVEAKF